jgi:tetratricopeptide (TPR) repeat protein
VSVGVVDYYEGRYGDAAALCAALLERDPSFGMAAYFQGLALTAMGRATEALQALGRAQVLTGGSAEVESALGLAQAAADDPASARATLARLQERARSRYVSPVLPAQVLVALGETEAAMQGLEEAYRRRAADVVLLDIKPAFEPLRGVRAFAALIERIRRGPGSG